MKSNKNMTGMMSAFFALGAIALTACQQDTAALDKRLKGIEDSLARIEKGGGARGAGAAPAPRRNQPDPKAVYAVPVDGDPSEGPADAKVTIVKGYEYACPYCEKVRPTLDELKKKYGNDIRIVYKQYVVHPQQATLPAQATCAAHKQGKFKQMDEVLWEKGFKGGRKFGEEDIAGYAKEAGLNVDKFKADMKDCAALVQKDQAELAKVGVTGTPAFYINGRFLGGAQPAPAFEAVIDEELKKANDRIAAGTPAGDYYKKFVVEQGQKTVASAEAPAPVAMPAGGAPMARPNAPIQLGAPGQAPVVRPPAPAGK